MHYILILEQILTYKGDCVNDLEANNRLPNPNKLLDAYNNSKLTLFFLNKLDNI